MPVPYPEDAGHTITLPLFLLKIRVQTNETSAIKVSFSYNIR